jgi:eukaryotic-like serine/threonine-protein kinase
MERWDEIAGLFDDALAVPPPERAAWLDKACAGRDDLRREVEEMLAAHEPDARLEIEEQLLGERDADPTFADGARLGSYRIRRWLGRGGMGDVYLGERDAGDFEQLVAIKVLRRGIAGAEAAARFRRERRILAHLTHPAVVPLLDSGVAADGRPYLVLQYVDGEPITRHCESQQLPVEARLRLFIAVCRAVQFAHGRLIIHRDLKPSNILVTKDGEARLLDFGIAKVLVPEDGEVELTHHAAAPMTPERAAPEQLRGEMPSTATDVWALGVLLYELVTGRLPFAVQGRSRLEIEREITDRDAPMTAIRGLRDLDTVIAKALRREPEQRYASAGQLADDVERVLAGQPILARPQSVAYRVRRFVGRNRTAVAASALAIVSLVAFAVATLIQSREVARERDRAAAEEVKANSVVDLLTEVLGGADPNAGAAAHTVDVNELLRRGESRALALNEQPAVQARLFHALGVVHLHRTNAAKAKELLARAYEQQIALAGRDDARALETAIELAKAEGELGMRLAAQARLRDAVARLEAHARTRPELLAEGLVSLAAATLGKEREELIMRSLELQRGLVPPKPMAVAGSLNQLAIFEAQRGARKEAAQHYREALALVRGQVGADHPHALTLQNNLATVLPDPAEQEALFRDLIAAHARRFGDGSSKVALAWNNLGTALAAQGRHDMAMQALVEARDRWTRTVGADHPQTKSTRRSIAVMLDLMGRRDEALREMREVADASATSPDRAGYARLRAQYGRLLFRAGRLEEAKREIEPAYAELCRLEPPGAANRTSVQYDVALLRLADGRAVEAERELSQVLAAYRKTFPADDPRVAEVEVALGRALVANGRAAEGRSMIRASLERFAKWGLAHPHDVDAARAVLIER